jgi:hypothetical protein
MTSNLAENLLGSESAAREACLEGDWLAALIGPYASKAKETLIPGKLRRAGLLDASPSGD